MRTPKERTRQGNSPAHVSPPWPSQVEVEPGAQRLGAPDRHAWYTQPDVWGSWGRRHERTTQKRFGNKCWKASEKSPTSTKMPKNVHLEALFKLQSSSIGGFKLFEGLCFVVSQSGKEWEKERHLALGRRSVSSSLSLSFSCSSSCSSCSLSATCVREMDRPDLGLDNECS